MVRAWRAWTERSTRGTGVVTSLNPSPARTWRIWAGCGAHPPIGRGTSRVVWLWRPWRPWGRSAAYLWRHRRDTVGLWVRPTYQRSRPASPRRAEQDQLDPGPA